MSTPAPGKSVKLWTPAYTMLLLVNLFSGMAGQMVVPIVAKYALHLGATLSVASTIASLMSLMGLFCCPFAGLVSDRVNRKWLMVISAGINGLSVLSHAFISSVPALVVIRLLTGVSFSFMSVATVAYTTAYIPRERLGEGMGYIALATIVAQAFGPGVGLDLLERFGYPITFVVAGIFALAGVLVVLIIPYHAEQQARPAGRRGIHLEDLFAPQLLLFTLLVMLLSAANGLASTFLTLIADERHIENIAVFFTAYAACMVFIRPFAGKLLDRKGIYIILLPSFLISAAGLVLVGVASTLWLIILAGVLKAFGQGAGIPSIQAHCVKVLSRERAGVATSTCQIGQHVGNALAPILGSYVVTAFSYRTLFCGYAVLMLALGWLLLFVQYRRDKRAA